MKFLPSRAGHTGYPPEWPHASFAGGVSR